MAEQTHSIDSRLLVYQTLLHGIATAAGRALTDSQIGEEPIAQSVRVASGRQVMPSSEVLSSWLYSDQARRVQLMEN